MKMVAARPVSEAARATPWAWLPAEAATTARPGASWAMWLYAPRILNDPVRCWCSGFSSTGRPARRDRESERSTGVARMTGVTPIAGGQQILEGDQLLRARAAASRVARQWASCGGRGGLVDPVGALGGSLVGAQPLHEDDQGSEQAGGLAGDPHQPAAGVQVGEGHPRRRGASTWLSSAMPRMVWNGRASSR